MLKNVSTFKTKLDDTSQKDYIVECEGAEVCIRRDRDYTRNHLWIKSALEGAKPFQMWNQRIGVTDYAQKNLREKVGLIEILKNNTVGEGVKAGEVFGTIYSRAHANLDEMRTEYFALDLIAPISGRITSINQRIVQNPEVVSESPYEEGWIATIAPDSDSNNLISAKAYKRLLEKKEDSPFRTL